MKTGLFFKACLTLENILCFSKKDNTSIIKAILRRRASILYLLEEESIIPEGYSEL